MKEIQAIRAQDTGTTDTQRRHLLSFLSIAAGAGALGVAPQDASAASGDFPIPRRALTGRDDAGKSVFKSFDVTSKIVPLDSRPGAAYYEMYATYGIPNATGHEPDPMPTHEGFFPAPGATFFLMVQFAPRPPEGTKPDPHAFEKYLEEISQKFPGMEKHFERDNPGMHTTDSVDYGILVRGEMILELDDGKTVHLRQGDCVVQNGTRHRWRNPSTEPALMAFVLIGAKQRE